MDNLITLLRKIIWILYIKTTRILLPLRTYPSWEHRALQPILRSISVVIDVGFNKGQFTSLALLYSQKSFIYSFDPSNQSRFYSRFFSKRYKNRFLFFNIGLGSKKSVKRLHEATSFDNSSFMLSTRLNNSLFLRSVQNGVAYQASIERLDFIESKISTPNCLLKIDTQGYEMEVLKGISSSLYNKIKWIYIELTDLDLYIDQSSRVEIESFLIDKGFELFESYNRHLDASGRVIYCDNLYRNATI